MRPLITGIDCSKKIIEYATQFVAKINSKTKFIASDVLDMFFENNKFDLFLISNNIVEYSYYVIK